MLFFNLKSLSPPKTFQFLSWLFAHVEKRLGYKGKVYFKNYDVKTWETNNCNTNIIQYLEKQRQSDNEIWSVKRI